MDEWIRIRNDAHLALTRAQDRSGELKSRFNQIKKQLLTNSIQLARAEGERERALAAYAIHPGSERMQEALTESREQVSQIRQEISDLETLMAASKQEFQILAKEIPLLRQARDQSDQLFWFGMFESLRERIRTAVGAEVEQAYAAYAASFARDLSREAFLKRLFVEGTDAERLAELRQRMAQAHPVPQSKESQSKTYSLAPPETGSSRMSDPTPGDEARNWAQMVRG
ncbi:MAG: hypothetical protein G8237_02430 [Magnetococcales bacterium]|nr:hypothetical protein [Magnetococcales bacterium]